MNPFVTSEISHAVENLRLLEAFVTAPLGLYSDIKMLRESLPFPEAADLPREQLQQRRIAYGTLSDRPSEMVLLAIASLGSSLDILAGINAEGEIAELQHNWVPRAKKVVDRAASKVGGDMRAGVSKRITGLYVIVDPEATKGRPVLEIAEASLKGGVRVLQLRDKQNDKGSVLETAGELTRMCESYDALFVMNDDADVARSCGAHGLHVGQSDLPISAARDVTTPIQIIGKSNNSIQQAMDSQAEGVDYIAVGAVYATATMGKGSRNPIGPETLREVKSKVSQPIVAIGGINDSNIQDVVKAGADCVCVVSAVTFADEPEQAARKLAELMASV